MPHVDDPSGQPSDHGTGRLAGHGTDRHAGHGTGQLAGHRTLPASALAGLREAFAGEVASRLPRLQALGDRLGDHEQAVRDAHALGSSAVVVGESEASRAARALEAELAPLAPGSPVPPSAQAHVQTLTVLLSPWLAA